MELTFILKKTISLLLLPLPMSMIILIGVFFFLYKNKYTAAGGLLILGVLWVFVFSYPPAAHALMYPLKYRYHTLKRPPQDLQYIYVLGGSGNYSSSTLPLGKQLSKESALRLAEGIRLYHLSHGKARLILSVYGGLFGSTSHALIQQKLAIALGIPPKDILVVTKAKDTQEEAETAKVITHNMPLAVVSSAYHMPRAMKWFELSGLHPYPAPIFRQVYINPQDYWNFFDRNALQLSREAFHEYFGMLWQGLKAVIQTTQCTRHL